MLDMRDSSGRAAWKTEHDSMRNMNMNMNMNTGLPDMAQIEIHSFIANTDVQSLGLFKTTLSSCYLL